MEVAQTEIATEVDVPQRDVRGSVWAWLAWSFWVVIGIVLPIGALVVEMVLGFCQAAFFDPIPTATHALLVALVPLSNILSFICLKRTRLEARSLLLVLNSAATVVATVYTLLFIPLLPLAAVYSAMSVLAAFLPALLTTLPFAPLGSLVANLRFARSLGAEPQSTLAPVYMLRLIGISLALFGLIVAEAPRVISGLALQELSEHPGGTSSLALARRFGDKETLRAAAYGLPNRDFLQWMGSFIRSDRKLGIDRMLGNISASVEPDVARRIYFQVTGENFNARPLPSYRKPWFSMFASGMEQGGSAVGALSEDLKLTQSTFDTSVSADLLTSYTEWTLSFHNSHEATPLEARAEVLLPEGGVVSRVTLWIDGEPVEALYGSRREATQAYQSIVRASRDPLLVTTSGPDRVLVQCFPVEAGKDMKIRIGITAPLKLENTRLAAYTPPKFIDRNFLLRDDLSHAFWVESKSELRTALGALRPEHPEDRVFGLRGSVGDDALAVRIEVPLQNGNGDVSSYDQDGAQVIEQTLRERPLTAASGAVFVIDGSAAMSDSVPGIVLALKAVPTELPMAVLIAGDVLVRVTEELRPQDQAAREAIIDQIRHYRFVGGTDNKSALVEAWDLAATEKNTKIVWIHSASPAKFEDFSALTQRQRRRPGGPGIYSIEVEQGPNRTLEQLDVLGLIADGSGPSSGEGLVRRVSTIILSGGRGLTLASRARKLLDGETAPPVYQHVNRLWAASEVRQRVHSARRSGTEAPALEVARDLALRFRLVTPLTGAVVLAKSEVVTTELQPASPGMVPSVPEPEMIMLAVVLGLIVLYANRDKALRVRRV